MDEGVCVDQCLQQPHCLDECSADEHQSPAMLALSIISTLVLLCFSGFFSGLTLGLMSLDMSGLELIEACGEPDQKKWAQRIMPIRRRGNLLLCTLLLGNTAVNSFIAISAAALTAGIVGAVLSTGFILIFGEIVPQSVCSRYGLRIGAMSVPVVKVFMVVFFPLAWPVSKILDFALGRELRTIYNRKELDKLLSIAVDDPNGDLQPEEKHLMTAALQFADKRASLIMTKLDHVFCIDVNSKLSFDALLKCYKSGFTRIPVYKGHPSCVVGLLFAKDLILVDPDDEIPVGAMLSFCGRSVHAVRHDTPLDKLLTAAQTQRSHLYFVVDANERPDTPLMPSKKLPPVEKVIGIVTLEDVLEELIADEIVDETDTITDNHSRDVVLEANAELRAKRMEFFYTVQAKRHPRRHVSEEELRAIIVYLMANTEPFARSSITSKAIRKMLNRCPVLTVEPRGVHSNSGSPVHSGLLFEKGKPADQCILVLSGQLRITCGEDEVVSEAGPWSLLALTALTEPEYTPDYAAEVVVTARLLQIPRDVFQRMLTAVTPKSTARDFKKAASTANAIDNSFSLRERSERSSDRSPSGGRSPGMSTRRVFDWDASTQRSTGAPSVTESAADMMLQRPPRARVPNVRSLDDADASELLHVVHSRDAPALTRSHSHPEIQDESEDDNSPPLCAILAQDSQAVPTMVRQIAPELLLQRPPPLSQASRGRQLLEAALPSGEASVGVEDVPLQFSDPLPQQHLPRAATVSNGSGPSSAKADSSIGPRQGRLST